MVTWCDISQSEARMKITDRGYRIYVLSDVINLLKQTSVPSQDLPKCHNGGTYCSLSGLLLDSICTIIVVVLSESIWCEVQNGWLQ